jgi:hypothetical protein
VKFIRGDGEFISSDKLSISSSEKYGEGVGNLRGGVVLRTSFPELLISFPRKLRGGVKKGINIFNSVKLPSFQRRGAALAAGWLLKRDEG